MPHIKTIPPHDKRHISFNPTAAIQPAKEAAARLKQRFGRFEIYEFLEAIYCIYVDWKHRKNAKRSARALADEMNIVRRKGMTPFVS